MMSSDSIAELTSELESVINQEVMETGEKLLKEYQENKNPNSPFLLGFLTVLVPVFSR